MRDRDEATSNGYRVGIDLDNNRWIDWAGNYPPNLVKNALWFHALPGGTLNGEAVDRMEKTTYGLMVRRFTGTQQGAFTRLGTNQEPLVEVVPTPEE